MPLKNSSQPLFSLTRAEQRWTLIWSTVVMLVTSLPYLYGAYLSSPAQHFSGLIIGVEDGYSYLSKMRMGAEGSWVFYLYTTEPHQGVYLYTFHLLLGKLSAATGLTPVLVYHTARFILGLGLLITVYHFVAFFTASLPVRRLAFLLVAFGSGLGWLAALTGWSNVIGIPLDTYLPEGFTFLILLHLPHVSLALACLLWGFILLLRAWQTKDRPWLWALLAGLAFFVALGVAAFYLAIIVIMPAMALALHFLRRRRWPWREIGLLALALLPSLPLILYNVWVFAGIEAYRIFGQQSVVRSPRPLHWLLAYGVLALLAIPGIRQYWQKRDLNGLFLIGWVVIVPFLVYLPFNQQRRLAMGVQMPLSILAAAGLYHLVQAGSHPRRWRRSSLALVLFAGLTNVVLLLGSLVTVSQQGWPLFRSRGQVEAMGWLASRAPGETIMALHETGNMLPAYASVKVFVGHGPETIRAIEKGEQAERFFGQETDDAWKRDLLEQFEIDYVYYGSQERAAGNFVPSEAPYLEEQYHNEDVQIYRVIPQVVGGQ